MFCIIEPHLVKSPMAANKLIYDIASRKDILWMLEMNNLVSAILIVITSIQKENAFTS